MVLLLVASVVLAAPPGQLACPPGTRFHLGSSVEGADTSRLCCRPKPPDLAMPYVWYACPEGDVPEGPWELSFADGGLRARGTYRRGREEGRSWMWRDGWLESETSWRHGERQGSSTFYFPDGGVARLTFYDGGVEEGREVAFFENGVAQDESFFEGGRREGPRRMFHPNGQLASEEIFVGGGQEGLARSYDAEGRLTSEERYARGSLDGVSTWWLPDGGIASRGTFRGGHRSGAWVESDGQETWTGSYAAEGRDGPWRVELADGGARTVVYDRGDEGEPRSCPPGTAEVRRCAARCCDYHARWCETPDGGKVGPVDVWDASGRPVRKNGSNGLGGP